MNTRVTLCCNKIERCSEAVATFLNETNFFTDKIYLGYTLHEIDRKELHINLTYKPSTVADSLDYNDTSWETNTSWTVHYSNNKDTWKTKWSDCNYNFNSMAKQEQVKAELRIKYCFVKNKAVQYMDPITVTYIESSDDWGRWNRGDVALLSDIKGINNLVYGYYRDKENGDLMLFICSPEVIKNFKTSHPIEFVYNEETCNLTMHSDMTCELSKRLHCISIHNMPWTRNTKNINPELVPNILLQYERGWYRPENLVKCIDYTSNKREFDLFHDKVFAVVCKKVVQQMNEVQKIYYISMGGKFLV